MEKVTHEQNGKAKTNGAGHGQPVEETLNGQHAIGTPKMGARTAARLAQKLNVPVEGQKWHEEWKRLNDAETIALGAEIGLPARDEDVEASLVELLHLGFGDFNVDFASSALRAIAIQALAIKEYVAHAIKLSPEDRHVLFSMAMDIEGRSRAAAEIHQRMQEAQNAKNQQAPKVQS